MESCLNLFISIERKNDGTIFVKNNINKKGICTAKKDLILERPLKKNSQLLVWSSKPNEENCW